MTRSPPRPIPRTHALLLIQCEQLRALIGEVHWFSSVLAGEADGRETLEALIQAAQAIAETGGTMGFDGIGQKAFALETFARQLLRKPAPEQREGVPVVRALTRALVGAAADVTPEQSRLGQRLRLRG